MYVKSFPSVVSLPVILWLQPKATFVMQKAIYVHKCFVVWQPFNASSDHDAVKQ
jgi:hypothetical protein